MGTASLAPRFSRPLAWFVTSDGLVEAMLVLSFGLSPAAHVPNGTERRRQTLALSSEVGPPSVGELLELHVC